MIVTEDTTIGELREELKRRRVTHLSVTINAAEYIVHLRTTTTEAGGRGPIGYYGSDSLVIALTVALQQLQGKEPDATCT